MNIQTTLNPAHSNGTTADAQPGAERLTAPSASAPIERASFRAYVDRLTRRRDRRGNRLPTGGVYHDPYPHPGVLETTALHEAIERIGEVRPARAAWLIHFYNSRLQPALQRFLVARDEADAEMVAHNSRVEVVNGRIESDQEGWRAEAAAARAPYEAAVEELDPDLEAAQAAAASMVARAGRSYDPAQPSEDALLRVDPPQACTVATEMGLPDPRLDPRALLPTWLSWVFTAMVGTMIGVSLGLIGGFLQPDTLDRQIAVVFAAAVLGLGIAAFGRKAIILSHRQASERAYLSLGYGRRWCFLLAALGTDLAILAVDLFVEREGLLKLARLNTRVGSLSGGGAQETDPLIWYIVPLIVTLGYVLYSAWEGYLHGRQSPIRNRVNREIELRHAAVREAHLARPEVRDALEAVLAVKEKLRRVDVLRGRADEAARPWEDRVSRGEAERLARQEELTPDQKSRIQDALDNLLGADWEFSVALERELSRLEARWPWWRRLLAGMGWGSARRLRTRKY